MGVQYIRVKAANPRSECYFVQSFIRPDVRVATKPFVLRAPAQDHLRQSTFSVLHHRCLVPTEWMIMTRRAIITLTSMRVRKKETRSPRYQDFEIFHSRRPQLLDLARRLVNNRYKPTVLRRIPSPSLTM